MNNPSALSVYITSPRRRPATPRVRTFLFSQLTTRPLHLFAADRPRLRGVSPSRARSRTICKQFISQQGNASTLATQLQQGQGVVVNTLQQKFNSTAGVNIDTEMSNLIQLQNTYAANAHIMSVVQSMMQTLLQAQV